MEERPLMIKSITSMLKKFYAKYLSGQRHLEQMNSKYKSVLKHANQNQMKNKKVVV